MVTASRFIDQIRIHGSKMIDAVDGAAADVPIPTCPEWTMVNLAAHTAAVYQHKALTIEEGWVESSPPWPSDLADRDDGGVPELLRASLDRIVGVLEQADPETAVYTWGSETGSGTVWWWARRMSHETLIHSADALLATGAEPKAETWLATDGIDEVLEEMLTGAPDWAESTVDGERFDLVTNGRRWKLRWARFSGTSPWSGRTYIDDDLLVFEGNGDPATVISAPAASINYWLWGRASMPDGAVSGDLSMVDRIRSYAADATG